MTTLVGQDSEYVLVLSLGSDRCLRGEEGLAVKIIMGMCMEVERMGGENEQEPFVWMPG